MCTNVTDMIRGGFKALVADGTLVGDFSCMFEVVEFEAGVVRVSHIALLTFVRFLSRVNSLVATQVGRVSKAFGT